MFFFTDDPRTSEILSSGSPLLEMDVLNSHPCMASVPIFFFFLLFSPSPSSLFLLFSSLLLFSSPLLFFLFFLFYYHHYSHFISQYIRLLDSLKTTFGRTWQPSTPPKWMAEVIFYFSFSFFFSSFSFPFPFSFSFFIFLLISNSSFQECKKKVFISMLVCLWPNWC